MADGDSSSDSRAGDESLVINHGPGRTICGYCRSTGPTSISHGLWANSLKADDYQVLLDRGWRRSGCYLYKPEMERTCCPSYTIRLKANDFICSKEQGRVLRKMQRFLDGDLNPQVGSSKSNPTKRTLSEPIKSPTSKVSKVSSNEFQASTCSNISKEDELSCCLSKIIDETVGTCFQGGLFSSTAQLPKAIVKTVKPQIKKKLGKQLHEKKAGEAVQDLKYTCNVSFQTVAAIRRVFLKEKGSDQTALLADLSPNSVAEKLAMTMGHLGELAAFEVKACNGHLNFYSATSQTTQNRNSIHAPAQVPDKSKQSSVNINNVKHLQKQRKLEISMSASHFDPEEYALYRRYQTIVHKEKTVSESSYRMSLVDTPIVFVPPRSGDNTVPQCGFGSFHQQYRIDGKLVAVGLVDILPKCLSSKYLFWDPDLAFLSLGKYTALKEIEWVKTAQEHCPSLQYYYLGYYVHSCNKMRYKAAYRPSELLCPVRYEWVRYDLAKRLLDRRQYSILSDFDKMQDEMPPHICDPSNESSVKSDHCESASDEDDEDLNDYESNVVVDDVVSHLEMVDTTEDGSNIKEIEDVILDLNNSRVKFKDLQQVSGPIQRRHLNALERELSRYVEAVGKELSDRMVCIPLFDICNYI